jgi:hypothetical protein
LAAGADYLRNRSPDPYGKRPYYWNIVITYDPKVRPSNDYDPAQPELWMQQHLPQAMLFGRGSLNIAYMRGSWGDRNELFASFKAGDMQAHHDHYDVGTFTIQRGGELAARSGFYADYTAPHRLNYYIQTVAANSILVMSPDETSSYLKLKFPERAWLSGGQRVIRPTGFNCVNLAHFEKQLDDGPHLRRARCLAWRSEPENFDYMGVDITAAYNSTIWSEPGQIAKVSKVTRQFLFLRSEEAFIIFDRVETCDKRFLPKVLLHTITKPLTENETVLFGTDENGILASRDRLAIIESGGGRMYQHVLLPAQMRLLKIGGPDYAFYAETDGDQSNGFNGMNLIEGSSRKPGSHGTDGWRIEIEPTEPSEFTTFLQVLVPRLIQGDRRALPPVKLIGETAASIVLRVGATTIEISRSGAALKQSHYKASGIQGSYLLLDAIPNHEYKIGDHAVKSCGEGVLWLP